MFLRRLFTILIVIISLLQIIPAVAYRYTYLECQKGYETWRCSANEKCGYTYESCLNDPAKPSEPITAGGTVKLIFGIIIWIGICIGSHFYRIHRRRQAKKRFARQIQAIAIVAQNQQQMVLHIISSPPVATTPLIQEESPPTYQQIEENNQNIKL